MSVRTVSISTTSLFIVLVLLSTSSLMAQGQEIKQNLKGTRSLEVFAGPSLVYNHGSEEYEEFGKVKVGYLFGLSVRHYLTNKLSINTSVSFQRKGFQQESERYVPPDIFNDPPSNNLPPELTINQSNLNNDYIVISLAPEGQFFTRKLLFGAGIYYGRLIKSQLTVIDRQNGDIVRKSSVDQYDSYKKDDWGLTINLGYCLSVFKNSDINLSLTGDYGIPNVIILKKGIIQRKNLAVGFLVAYKII